MRAERGQATVEWTALLLASALALAALGAAASHLDGRSFGGLLAHRIACAARGGCDDGDGALARAYGARDAGLVREFAPSLVYEPGEAQLPVDWRGCRSRRCADAPDDPDLDVHRSRGGKRATAFTHVVHAGGRTYLQYWLYYPESNTALARSDWVWNHTALRLLGRYPGFHRDDWEGYAVRIDPDGSVWARATSHRHWQGCKTAACRNAWVPASGWARVSRGSHAGHIPGRVTTRFEPALPGHALRERTSTGAGLRLVPLETLARGRYRPLAREVSPPWGKSAYANPESDSS